MIFYDQEKSLHAHWVGLICERLKYDLWSLMDAELLLSDIWPVGAEIKREEHNSFRYGLLEPPIVLDAGILTEDSNLKFEDFFIKEPLLLHASKKLGYVSRILNSQKHNDSVYPVDYFVGWAKQKKLVPCWLHLADLEWGIYWVSRPSWNKLETMAILKGFNPEKIYHYEKHRANGLQDFLDYIVEWCGCSNVSKLLDRFEGEGKLSFPVSPLMVIDIMIKNNIWIPDVIEESYKVVTGSLDIIGNRYNRNSLNNNGN